MKIIALLAPVLFASHCFGEEITIGRSDSGNGLPFSSMIEYANKQPIYQQAYNADAFNGDSINIKTISFASSSSPGGGGYASYEVSNSIRLWIGISQNPYDSLSNVLSSNVDTHIEKKFSGSVTAILQNDNGQDEFDYHIVLDTPFYYDPSMGDLIIQIEIHGGYALNPARESGGNFAFAAGRVDVGRAYEQQFSNTPGTGVYGLYTQFSDAEIVTPSPWIRVESDNPNYLKVDFNGNLEYSFDLSEWYMLPATTPSPYYHIPSGENRALFFRSRVGSIVSNVE